MRSPFHVVWTLVLFLPLVTLDEGGNPSSTGSSKYEGSFLGKLNTYSHQVTGDVYVIDEYTFLIKNFHFDGLSQDAFFWAGATTVRPSNVGFIIPDENGRTNRLKRYINQDVRIRIPDDKKINSLKWLSIWDIRDNQNFADIYIPDGFEPPSPKKVGEFSSRGHGVRSGSVTVIDSKTIRIEDLFYDGQSNTTFFFVGTGPQPNPSGKKIPNDLGYLESLSRYSGETITLHLPGDMTVIDVDWISIWDDELGEDYGHINLPEGLNIPPSLAVVKKRESRLPNCEQLHEKVQLSWEIFGPQITFELSAEMSASDYIAFGISGSPNSSRMVGADVAISYLQGPIGYTEDYNITDRFPCTNVNGFHRGVCPDSRVGGVDNFQYLQFQRVDGVTRITFRRNLQSADESDFAYSKDPTESTFIVWAIGRMNRFNEPRFHSMYPRKDVKISFGRKPEKNCFSFVKREATLSPKTDDQSITTSAQLMSKPWRRERISNESLTTFYARIGVSGMERGYQGVTDDQGSPGYVWYINGLMAPVIYVKRGQQYTFRVEGGNNPSKPEFYHPLYITNDQAGGYSKYREEERKSRKVYAGIDFDKKGRPSPKAAGRLCLWSYPDGMDPRRVDSTFHNFIQFREKLIYSCELGTPGVLTWTPNASTPDQVFYQSYTQRNMGWKIIVLDDFSVLPQHASTSSAVIPVGRVLSQVRCLILVHLFVRIRRIHL